MTHFVVCVIFVNLFTNHYFIIEWLRLNRYGIQHKISVQFLYSVTTYLLRYCDFCCSRRLTDMIRKNEIKGNDDMKGNFKKRDGIVSYGAIWN